MHVAELFHDKAEKPIISYEISRPKTEKAAANLEKALDKLIEAEPDYMSVTFGAGGSTRGTWRPAGGTGQSEPR